MSVPAVSSVQPTHQPPPVQPVSQVKGSDPDGDGDSDAGGAEASPGPYSGQKLDTRA